MKNNTATVQLTDGREVFLSYGVPVAAFIPRGTVLQAPAGHTPEAVWWHENPLPSGYVKTDRKYSVTTSKHANAYAGASATVVPDAIFVALVSPLDCKR